MRHSSSQHTSDQNQCTNETAFDTRMCVCVCVCVCVCACAYGCVWVGGCVGERERERERDLVLLVSCVSMYFIEI